MMHLHRHSRFYFAVIAGILAFFATWGRETPLRILLAGDVFFGTFLGLMVTFALRITPDALRRRAAVEDEGWPLILLLTAVAAAFGLAATFMLINQPHRETPFVALLAVASVPVSWAMVHTLAAFHYANLFYVPTLAGTASRDAGGLDFPATPEPGMLDFIYYSFVIGMTAQVSDVAVKSRSLRQATLLHGILSFFYNAVLIALAVNAAISFAG